MPYYDVANQGTVTKMNMMDKMHCSYESLRTTAVRIQHLVSQRAAQRFQLLSKSPPDLCRHPSCSKVCLSYKSNLGVFWMHLHNCKCYQEHLRMLLLSLSALCLAPGGPGSIRRQVEALVRSTSVSGRFVCGFWTELHFANVARITSLSCQIQLL